MGLGAVDPVFVLLVLLSKEKFCYEIFDALILEQQNYSFKTTKKSNYEETASNNLDLFSKKNEMMFLMRTLKDVRWNKSEAARKLGISRATLYRRLKMISDADEKL